jgi:hypothetical protein
MAAEAVAATNSTTPRVAFSPDYTNPPKLFILPKNISADARIFTIPDPKSPKSEARYLCCPEKGFYEFTKINAPASSFRSWLLVPSDSSVKAAKAQDTKISTKDNDGDFTGDKGYITKSKDIFIATPIDPVFLILPALSPPPAQSKEEVKRRFLDVDSHFDTLIAASPHYRALLSAEATRKGLEARIAAVCETVEAGDESMYRLDESKLLTVLLEKAKRMVEMGLPASMEEKLVRKALEVPMLSLKRGASTMQESFEEEGSQTAPGAATPSADSQTTTTSIATLSTAESFASTAATSVADGEELVSHSEAPSKPTPTTPPITAPEGVPALLRLRTALTFITNSYLPPHLASKLLAALNTPSSTLPDFTPLNTHLAHLASLRREALASRSLGDYTLKRSLTDDFDDDSRAEKKRKKEEEEKRKKAGESRGVRDLKKVNVSGMKKMSDFFKKK